MPCPSWPTGSLPSYPLSVGLSVHLPWISFAIFIKICSPIFLKKTTKIKKENLILHSIFEEN